jgi:cytidylate kinase
MIVAIDGPAGAGKSTVARRVAAKLGFAYLDSGALYRTVAWKALGTGTDPTSPAAMKRLLEDTRLRVSSAKDGGLVVEVDGRLLTEELRTPDVSRAASQVAAIPEVRAWLMPVQRDFGKQEGLEGIVAEGRDMGTRVFPDAPVKFFLSATPAERARRRHEELRAAGQAGGLNEIRRELEARDGRDQSREIAPLVPAADAVVFDTTTLSLDQVVERILKATKAKATALR